MGTILSAIVSIFAFRFRCAAGRQRVPRIGVLVGRATAFVVIL
jgi:hypothetical protein